MSTTSKISIHLGSSADLSGIDKAKRSLADLGAAAGKLGSVFGGANSLIGDFFRNLTKGSIWQAGASAIGFVYKKIVECVNAAREAEKQAAKEAKEAADERIKAIADYSAAVDKLAQTRQTSISQHLKNLNDEIDATKDLTKATLELQRAEARKRGDSAAVAAIEEQMDALDFSAAREKLTNEITAVTRRRESERAAVAGREKGLSDLTAVIGKLADEQERAIRSARERATTNAMEIATASPSIVGGFAYVPASAKTKQRFADQAEEELRKSDEFKAVVAQIEDARKRADDFRDKLAASRRELVNLDEQERNLVARREAVDVRERAKRTNDEADRADEARKAAEKSAEETRRAEVAAAQKAAIERDRLDRELHKKRMADLRAEIAEQSKATAPLRAVASAAQGEFERAFALYRDPTAAAAAVADEKSRAADLDRLHADAARYGGKWRIDELSRLMAAGDAQGQSDTLAAWRKSSRFTPEVEAMVRASAAERTKTTAEDELRKIESNTSDLARKLDELISMKGG